MIKMASTVRLAKWLVLKKISCPIVLFLCYPSMVGALLLLQSLLILAMLHPWQLLGQRLSLVADDMTDCRVVVNVVLRNRIYDDISNVIGPIYSVEFFRVDRVCVPYQLI